MIRVQSIHKSFQSIKAVHDLSFEAKDGQITALLGPNGAGKSTTMRIISGLLNADQGQVHIDDFDSKEAPMQARQRLGLLPDGAGLYPRLTAYENIEYFAHLCGLSPNQARASTQQVIENMGIETLAKRRTQVFSQGERMKVALARALVHAPQNLVLDEPTNGLDVMSTRSMRRRLLKLKEEGRCLIVSSHIMQEISAISDVIVVVAQGRVVAQGTLEQLCDEAGSKDFEEAFVRLCGLDLMEKAAQ